MFERFTDEGRQTVHNAKCLADDLGSSDLATEHILLALLKDAHLSDRLLDGVSSQELRDEILGRVTQKANPHLPRDISYGVGTQQALLFAVEEADLLGDRHVGNRHILLGLLRLENCLVAEVLNHHGLTFDKIRLRAKVL